MIWIFLATEIFYIFATDAVPSTGSGQALSKVEGAHRGHRDIRHEKAQKFLILIYTD